jgi:hypothetical protein
MYTKRVFDKIQIEIPVMDDESERVGLTSG